MRINAPPYYFKGPYPYPYYYKGKGKGLNKLEFKLTQEGRGPPDS